jgi:hypothetical protein
MVILTKPKGNVMLLNPKHNMLGLLFDTRQDLQEAIDKLQNLYDAKDQYVIFYPPGTTKWEIDKFKESLDERQVNMLRWCPKKDEEDE